MGIAFGLYTCVNPKSGVGAPSAFPGSEDAYIRSMNCGDTANRHFSVTGANESAPNESWNASEGWGMTLPIVNGVANEGRVRDG